jgi:nicotinamide mononucleotide transporter
VNWLNSEAFTLFGQHIKWADMIGNVIGLIGLALGWRRSLWTWPAQFVSGLILFTAFVTAHLSGSAGKQVVVMLVAVWGFRQWNRGRQQAQDGSVAVRFATWRERGVLPGTPGRTPTSSSARSSRCTPRRAAWSSSGSPGCSSTSSASR